MHNRRARKPARAASSSPLLYLDQPFSHLPAQQIFSPHRPLSLRIVKCERQQFRGMAMRSEDVAGVIVHGPAGGIDYIDMEHVHSGGRAAREMQSNLRGPTAP